MNPHQHLILYVDDEHANRVVFEATFGRRLRVRCVDSGEAALEVLRSEEVAVLVTDQRMPGLTGDQLLKMAKELSPETLRIVVTAYSDVDPILKAVNEGLVVRYIIKPWDRAELEGILNWALEAYLLGKGDSALQQRLVQTERLLTLGQVTASILHDVRSPLQVIVTNAQRLAELSSVASLLKSLAAGRTVCLTESERADLDELADDIPDLGRETVESATAITRVLEQIQPYMRSGMVSSEPRETDPVAVIRFAISMVRDKVLSGQTSVTYDGPPELPSVRASATELSQVLINLLRNALQALAESGCAGRVILGSAVVGDAVRFVISDDGPGMSADVLERVGTPFFSTRSGGTGLGIAQCKRLVGRFGGQFDIDSNVGKGTTVTVTVPIAGDVIPS